MQTEKISLQPNQDYIKLDNALKMAGIFPTGGQAKLEIQSGNVTVNGEVCTQRGKKLHIGDKAEYNGTVVEVC